MQVGESVIAKHEGQIKEFHVTKLLYEEVELSDGIITIYRKYWEVQKLKYEKE